jgi:hypothetical protein
MIPIYIINRADRPERLTDIRQQLAFQNLNAHRFEAVIDRQGWKGCVLSHLAVMEKCKKEIVCLVLEDDCIFLNDINPYLQLAIEQMPKTWDMLMLGGSPQQPQERYSDNLFRVRNVKTSHAILWHTRFNGAVEWILRNREQAENMKWDVFLMEWIQSCFNCFITYPMILTQKQGKSDISRRTDCSTIEKNFNKYCI